MKEKKNKNVPTDERLELVRQIKVLELKIEEKFIYNRSDLIQKITNQVGLWLRLFPSDIIKLIEVKDELINDFESLNNSALAMQHKKLFISEINKIPVSIENNTVNKSYKTDLEKPIEPPSLKPLSVEEILDNIKNGIKTEPIEDMLQNHMNKYIARESLKEIWQYYEHYMNEVIEHIRNAIKQTDNNNLQNLSKPLKDKLTHKQQILLLRAIGFFELEFFKLLNETQKGVLVSHIVNRDEKNAEDNIRYIRGKRSNDDTKKIFTKENVKVVNELLEKVGLEQYKVS